MGTLAAAGHLHWVEYVLKKLVKAGFRVNQDKCEFSCSQVRYLGYLLDEEGLRPDADRIASIVNYFVPHNLKALRRFLGMVRYYAIFFKRDSEMKVFLTKLLRQDQPYVWDDEQQEAFDALKKAFISAPVLARPDFSKPFTIQAASDLSIKAVLTQLGENGEHPIVFWSHMFTDAEKNYMVTELECLAIKKLRAYIEGKGALNHVPNALLRIYELRRSQKRLVFPKK